MTGTPSDSMRQASNGPQANSPSQQTNILQYKLKALFLFLAWGNNLNSGGMKWDLNFLVKFIADTLKIIMTIITWLNGFHYWAI